MPIKIVPKNDGMDEDQELDQFGGFGREAVEEAAKRPTYASTQGQVDDRDRREAAVAGPLKKPAPKEDEPKKTFKQAFAQARKDGGKTFMFNGKKYTTELKDEKKDKPTKKEEAKESTKQMADDRRVKKLGVFGAKGKNPRPANPSMFKKGGSVKSSASKRADGIAMKGKTRGRMV
jgi:hypothetical protein